MIKLHCIATKEGDQYTAMCLDFCLAAQSESLEEANEKLKDQIKSYIKDAMDCDKKNQQYLLGRRAPDEYWAKYYLNYRSDFTNQAGYLKA